MPPTRPPDNPSGLPDTPADAARITDGVRRGDRAAFSLLYKRFAGLVFDLARSLTGRDEQFCLDVLQETMMRAIRSLPSLDSDAALGAWLSTTARRVAIDLLRKEWRRSAREQARYRLDPPPSPSQHTSPPSPASEESAWLRTQLQTLDPDTELWLRRHLGDGTSLQSLADQSAHATTRDALYGKVRRALAALRHAAREGFNHE